MVLTGKMGKTDWEIFLENTHAKKRSMKTRTRIMTITGNFLPASNPFSHDHRFGVLRGFLQFLAL